MSPLTSSTSSGGPSDATTRRRLIVVHDVLGTLFSLSRPIQVVLDLFGSQLGSDERVRERFAELVVMDWYHCAQRDFCMLSLNGAYTPIGQVFRGTLDRVLLMSGLLPPPPASASTGQEEEGAGGGGGGGGGPAAPQRLEDVRKRAAAGEKNIFGEAADRIFATLPTLEARPGMVEAFSKVYRDEALTRAAGLSHVALWGATNGSLDLAGKLFDGALGPSNVHRTTQVKSAGEGGVGQGYGIWSCDEVKVAKPDPRVYEAVKERVLTECQSAATHGNVDGDADGGGGDSETSLWFVASHSWDTDAAKRAGFKTCWVSYEEFHPTQGTYLPADLTANTLDEAARKILEWEQGTRQRDHA
ncbi:unnamed protein product [Parajaminaea phylloscopi]